MSERWKGMGGAALAVLALAACCALGPLVLLTATGLLVSGWGSLARYWPLTFLGLAAALWAGGRLAKVVSARARASGYVDARDR